MHGGSLLSLSLCLSIIGCGIIIIYFFGVAGGEHRDAAGFDTGAETEKYEARCVGQEPRLLLLCPFFSDESAYRSVSWPLGPTVSRNEAKVIVQNA